MTTWQTLLRDGDPAADARLSVDDVAAMRRAVIVAAREPRPEGWAWQRPLAMAMALVMMIASGIVAGRRAAIDEATGPPPAVTADEPERRQLQFSTPGGTRIIWVFNSEFALKVTTPGHESQQAWRSSPP